MVDDEDKDALLRVLEELDGAFVTGSYLVDKDKANDIDVVVSWTAWKLHAERQGENTDYRESSVVGYALFTKQSADADGEKYGDEENEMFELVEHWRSGGINILVIRDNFLPAYRAASYYLEGAPHRYKTREHRVEIHQKMKAIIREMLDKAANSGDELPW